MTNPADPLLPPDEIAVLRLHQLEWVRRTVVAAVPDAVIPLAGAITALAGSAAGGTVAAHPFTGSWLRTAVRLVQRRAAVLLPHGHLTGHLGAARNLTAAVAVLSGASAVEVRFDCRGTAVLPGSGRVLTRGLEAAGTVQTVDVADIPGLPTTAGGVDVDGPVGSPIHRVAREACALLGPRLDVLRQGRTILVVDGDLPADPRDLAVAVSTMQPPTAAQLAGLIEGAVRAASAAEQAPVAPVAPAHRPAARGELAVALEVAGVPPPGRTNRITDDELRRDASFDHLSLLSVNDPAAFSRIERCAAVEGDGDLRLSAHCAYIGREFGEAARRYGACLLESPEDVDLWRDLCWALRHDGREDLATTWVLHPAAAAAAARNWRIPDRADPTAGLRAAVRVLEGMTVDLRTG